MVTLEFHDPSGRLEVTQPHAPRLASLEGKRIGFVSNEQWQAYRMLPLLKTLLEQDFAGHRGAADRRLPAGQRPDRHRGDRGAGQAERCRRRHHRQRGLRVLRHSMRPCSRQDRSARDSDRHADARGFRGRHEECGLRPRARARRRDGDVPDRDVPARQRHRAGRGAQARVLRRADALDVGPGRRRGRARSPMVSVAGRRTRTRSSRRTI